MTHFTVNFPYNPTDVTMLVDDRYIFVWVGYTTFLNEDEDVNNIGVYICCKDKDITEHYVHV